MNKDDAWRYASTVYAQPDMAGALLARQDEHGVDVVLHLFTQYLRAELGLVLDPAALAEADRLMKCWREEVIEPLRAVRRATKEKSAPGADGEQAGQAVHRLLTAAELRAERAELDALCDWFSARRSR